MPLNRGCCTRSVAAPSFSLRSTDSFARSTRPRRDASSRSSRRRPATRTSPRPSDASIAAFSNPRLMDMDTDGAGGSAAGSAATPSAGTDAGFSSSKRKCSSARPRAFMPTPSTLARTSPANRGARRSWFTRSPSKEISPLNLGSYSPSTEGT